jgi:Spy/CpxP family protein refolding chaperone
MKTKVLVGLGLTGLLATGLYAATCDGSGYHKGMKKGMNNQSSGKHMMMKQHSKKSNHSPIAMMKKLNLSDDQQKQIMQIRQGMMKNRVTADVAFTKDGFNKTQFIEIMKQKRDNMLESKAEMIDKVYKILTPKQKEQLKVLMDLKKEKMISMMEKRMSFDTNSNGRR